MEKIEYKTKLVAFIDILGFKNYLDDKEKLEKLYDVLKFSKEKSNEIWSGDQVNIIIFSDSILIESKIEEFNDFANFTKYLSRLIINLMLERIFVRGAINIGDHFSKDDIFISPALSEAYLSESKYAKYPRIIASKSFLNELYKIVHKECELDFYDKIEEYLLTDNDGMYYLDTFNIGRNFKMSHLEKDISDRHSEKLNGKSTLEFLAYTLKESIQHGIENKNIDVKSKFIWLAHQHNEFIENTDLSPKAFYKLTPKTVYGSTTSNFSKGF